MNYAKPPALKLVHGTARPDRAQASVELPKADSELAPPPTLDAFGKARWRELIKQYAEAGLMDKVDQIGLENLCMSYQRGRAYRKDETRAEKDVTKWEGELEGALAKGDEKLIELFSDLAAKARSSVQIARANQRRESATTRQYLQEFGATPGSKRRLPTPKASEEDPLSKIIAQNQKKKATG